VFATVSTKADERAVFEFFSEVGRVTDVRLITDRYGRFKGFVYVEMADATALASALALSGRALLGQPVQVRGSQSEKNVAWRQGLTAPAPGAPPMGTGGPVLPAKPLVAPPPPGWPPGRGPLPFRVELKNLLEKITGTDVRAICEPFGRVVRVDVAADEEAAGYNKSMVFFAVAADAARAAAQLDGLDLAGRKIRAKEVPLVVPASAQPPPPPIEAVNEIDDREGLKMDAQGRAALMQRLAGKLKGEDAEMVAPLRAAVLMPPRPAPAPVPAGTAAGSLRQGVLGPSSPVPTPCLLLSNLFDPAEETAEGWEREIAEDVREECEEKCGQVVHIHVHRDSPGDVYVRFDKQDAAERAHEMMDGRWFAARQVSCSYQFLQLYAEHFQKG